MTQIRKVMFPVAGLGTRFLPATKAVAKEMLPVVDKPLIQYAVEEAVEAGATSLVFITARHKHAISDHFGMAYELESKLRRQEKQRELHSINILDSTIGQAYVPQPEALGLGHAVWCGRDAIGDEPFGVILPDDLIKCADVGCMAQMASLYQRSGLSVLAVEEVDPADTGRYGIVSTQPFKDGLERIEAIVEKPKPAKAPSNLAVVGRYILSPRIFHHLGQIGPGAGNEIQLTDAIAGLATEEPVLCYRFSGERYDCGSKLGFIQATLAYALDHPDIATDFWQQLEQLFAARQ